uniref:ADP-ribosylation factor-like protein 14 n=1 Tax=Sinocyclocheilus anshuiensis TaxID=1608454 RepID=A0A671PZG9_9TELE
MGLLFAKLMTVFGDREHKVIIVGLDNAGKTTILYQFLTKEAVQTSPTIGSNVEEIAVKKTRFLVWDIGGQESLRATWNSYYCNTEIVILVVDSTDRERLTVTKKELHRMLAHEDLQDASVLVLANKQDMKNSMSAAEISQSLTLSSLNAHSWHVQACCALTGEGYVCFLGVRMFTCVFSLFKMFPSPDLSESLFILMCNHPYSLPLQFTSQSRLDAFPCCGELEPLELLKER